MLSHPPLLNALATLLLHPRLDLATVSFAADGTAVALPLADAGPARNALRAALLGCLSHPDERLVLLASCLLLASYAAPTARCLPPPPARADGDAPNCC